MEPHVDLIVTLHAHKERIPALREALLRLRLCSLGESGCLDYRIAQAATENTFYLLERWTDAMALEQHERTSHFLEGVKEVQDCCEFVDIQRVVWCD